MTNKKNFILLSMEDEKIKKISNVISNDSCRKILDYLSNKDATESELASKLNIPISTVHYNLQQLMETGLIEAEEFHYSKKGKEINHYKLANKYIIIAPKKTFGIKEKLRGILPAALIVSGTALAIQLVSKYSIQSVSAPRMMAEKSAEIAPMMAQAAEAVKEPNIALWFFIGAIFALAIYLLIKIIRKDVD